MNGPPWSGTELDFFEFFGWGSRYTAGSDWSKMSACLGCWFASPHPELDKFGFSAENGPAEPDKTQHTYTTYVWPTSSGKYRYALWIDGVKQKLVLAPNWGSTVEESPEVTPVAEERLNLILTYALREANGRNEFTSGSNSETVRSIAVYEDAAHAGVGVEDGGIAPGTSVG
jgi:hypothetical protein